MEESKEGRWSGCVPEDGHYDGKVLPVMYATDYVFEPKAGSPFTLPASIPFPPAGLSSLLHY